MAIYTGTEEKNQVSLVPCPCGSSDLTVGYYGQPAQKFFILCQSCGAHGPTVPNTPGGGAVIGPEWNNWLASSSASQLLAAADEVRLRLSEQYQSKMNNGTSVMEGNQDWARLEGAVAVITKLRAIVGSRNI